MKNFQKVFLALTALLAVSSCQKRAPPPDQVMFFEGPTKLTQECFSWIEVDDGPAVLNCTTISNGVCSKGIDAWNCDLGYLGICGNALIKNTLVRGYSEIQGRARYCESKILQSVSIGRDLQALGTTFRGPVTLCGDLNAKCCAFLGPITTAAECVTLSGVKASSIYFCPAGEWPDKQVLKLKHGSRVGKVIFQSGRGCVIKDCSSSCGEVYGGHFLRPYPGFEQPWREVE